jgi:hypothetical protein
LQVDWDEVLEQADATPRSILAEVLARADEVKDLALVFVDTEGEIHFYASTQASVYALGLLRIAEDIILKEGSLPL